MKKGVFALVFGLVGVFALRAGPVTEITSGYLWRAYDINGHNFLGETDGGTVFGTLDGVDFSISAGFGFAPNSNLGPYSFTDHISALVSSGFCAAPCQQSLGRLVLDVQTTITPPPIPNGNPVGGQFVATGSYTDLMGGTDVPFLIGQGVVTIGFYTYFDPDPRAYEYFANSINYTFVPTPEPMGMLLAAFGLVGIFMGTRSLERLRVH